MNRFTTFLLAFVLSATWMLMPLAALAEGNDYSALTTTELQDIIAVVRNELLERSALSEGKVFLTDEAADVQIYLTGKGDYDWNGYALEMVVINNGDRSISIEFNNIVVNGWETITFRGAYVKDIGAGHRKKAAIPLALDKTDVSSISEVEEVELVFRIYDALNGDDTLKRYGPITIYYDGSNWFNITQ